MKEKKSDILRQLKAGEEPRVLKLDSPAQCSTYNSLAWRYNVTHGRRENKYIHVCIDYEKDEVELTCTTYEEYLREKDHKLPQKWWKKRSAKKKPVYSEVDC